MKKIIVVGVSNNSHSILQRIQQGRTPFLGVVKPKKENTLTNRLMNLFNYNPSIVIFVGESKDLMGINLKCTTIIIELAIEESTQSYPFCTLKYNTSLYRYNKEQIRDLNIFLSLLVNSFTKRTLLRSEQRVNFNTILGLVNSYKNLMLGITYEECSKFDIALGIAWSNLSLPKCSKIAVVVNITASDEPTPSQLKNIAELFNSNTELDDLYWVYNNKVNSANWFKITLAVFFND